ncbi:fatty acid desaturase family protein [Chitinophaga nivalis]|uniref:Fatty acid desaturase n=1 Tax=Chitinophaga nivalis TaxID=2991709 RepID=A0ABT3IUI2_9BACT|nr:fatty acid desaturase [Chitinophaga nivalis]MCW3462935.1 fatty acid desaturase [Chitinophaga nivalis]MCW3487375.1 fatty acid desaturase [Chitinophaga nivalis]
MKYLSQLTDPVYQKPEKLSSFDRFLLTLIRDERDLPFLHLTLKITFTLWPLAIILYIPGLNNWLWWAAAIAYHFFNNLVFKGPFGLMLHCTSHRVFFEKKYQFWNHYLPWAIGPLFGQTPEGYYSHHIGMHHPENNMPEDDSSTMMYQRDSFSGFLHYLGSFIASGVYDTACYFLRKKRNRLCMRLVRGELIFLGACVGLSFINFPATFAVFILPFIISRVIMMVGNWAQHAFVCAVEPENSYKNSITCINTKYNHKCWNDGYHISHHVKPSMHWTEHPVYFKKTLDEYISNDAIVFDGIHFLHVWFYLMGKRYDLLAKHFVNIGDRFETDAEIMSFLQQRTRRIVTIPMPTVAAA